MVSTLALGLLLSGCTMPGGGSGAERAATTFARAVSAGQPTRAGFTSRAGASSYAETVAGMTPARPQVQAGEVSTDGDTGTATVTWHWSLSGQTWTYQTRARLRRAPGGDRPWRVVWAPSLVERSLRAGDRLSLSRQQPRRGDILGAGDAPLVTLRPVVRVGLDKTAVPQADAAGAATRLAQVTGIDPAAYVKLVAAAGPQAFVEAIVYRQGEVPAAVRAATQTITGARQLADQLPLPPSKQFASGLLGSVGPATAEIVRAGHGRVGAGDEVGVSGLQKRYDEQLFGTAGATVSAVHEASSPRVLHRIEPVDGKPLRTTLDPRLQQLADRALSSVGPASALVAVRPSDGALLAVGNGPGAQGQDIATYGRYAPGSTFKIVSTLALLRAGLRPTSRVSCPRETTVSGKRFTNYSDYPASAYGSITLTDALANSCNTAFVSSRQEVQHAGLAGAAAALGLGVDHDLGFPAYLGQVPAPTSPTGAAADLIGQGTVEASPMAMATVLASVVEGGVVVPRLLPDQKAPRTEVADPLTAAEATALRTMLHAVVERGSGRGLADLPGPPVLAKTGTAEFGDTPPLPTHAWMVGAQGDLAVAVFVDRGASGSQVAGPVLRHFLAGARSR